MKKWLIIIVTLVSIFLIPALVISYREDAVANRAREKFRETMFSQAVNSATTAAELTQEAKSREEWKNVAQLWREAIESLSRIDEEAEVYDLAQEKISTYQVNLEYAQTNAAIGPVEYTVVDRQNVSIPGRTRLSASIVAPDALTFEQRAQTAMKAAKELQESTNGYVITVFLVPSPDLVGMGINLAIARYAVDGRGYSGDQNWQWEVQATDEPVDAQQLRITELWEEKQASFLIPDGYGGMKPDEKAVDEAVAAELGIDVSEVRTLSFFLDDYTDF